MLTRFLIHFTPNANLIMSLLHVRITLRQSKTYVIPKFSTFRGPSKSDITFYDETKRSTSRDQN